MAEGLRRPATHPAGPPEARAASAEFEGATLLARQARVSEAPAIAGIYNEEIEDRLATFETEPRSADQIARWFDTGRPILVAENPDGMVIAFAAGSAYRDRPCYAGIAEFSVYVRHDWRSRGAGQVALAALVEAAGATGLWNLVSRVFPENTAERAAAPHELPRGRVYQRHGQIDGVWRD